MFVNKISKNLNPELSQIDEQTQYSQVILKTSQNEETAQNFNKVDIIVENITNFESSSGDVEKTRNNTQGLVNDFLFKHL